MITRRRFAAGAAALLVAPPAFAAGIWPNWADRLRRRLDRMAMELTTKVTPWSGPSLTVGPERFGCSIQAAIDHVSAQGGGTVLLAEGDYVSGTIDLRSHVRLQVAKGARLLGSLSLADYPERVARRPTVMDSNMGMHQSLIFAEGCENIALAGEGIIDGRGTAEHFPGPEGSGRTPGRPFLIRVIDCQGVHVQGLTLRDSACWMQDYLNCDRLLIEDLIVDNQANVNNDGCDIDGCRDVIVRDCLINSEDDGLCFKGASQRPTERVLVENCRIYSTCNPLKLGTDSQSPFRDVLVRNVELGGPGQSMRALRRRRAESGVSWEIVDGGIAENVLCTGIHIVRADSPLFLRLGDRGRVRPEQERPPAGRMRRIVFDGITGTDNGAHGSYFTGLPGHRIEDVALRGVDLGVGAAETPALDQAAIAEMPAVYPGAPMVRGPIPAFGLWARHVEGLTLQDVRFVPAGPETRPEVLADFDVKGLVRG
ncbi:MAG TPA: glycosyl hydrolase family 28 protein [Magnetospirillaceae bacterium]|nr:glycosyl hydrolase family 28 protein [Magnetospirillaceae bacterium]